jgi:hypothetical protein
MTELTTDDIIDEAIIYVKKFDNNHPIIKYLEDIKNYPDIKNNFIYFGINFLNDFLSLKKDELHSKESISKINCTDVFDYNFSIEDNTIPIKYKDSEHYTENNSFIITESSCWNYFDFQLKNPHVKFISKKPIEIKADWIDFIGSNLKRGKIITYKQK